MHKAQQTRALARFGRGFLELTADSLHNLPGLSQGFQENSSVKKKKPKSKQPEKAAAFPEPLPRDGWDRAGSWLLACKCQDPQRDVSEQGSLSALGCKSITHTPAWQSLLLCRCPTFSVPQPGGPRSRLGSSSLSLKLPALQDRVTGEQQQ